MFCSGRISRFTPLSIFLVLSASLAPSQTKWFKYEGNPVPALGQMRFDRITVDHGLSNSIVTCIIQDRHGFMWFGTDDGLNKFDGYQFTIYRHDAGDSNSLSNSLITAICEDRSGTLWIGTNGGLNKLDPATEKFTRYTHEEDRSSSLSNNAVLSIVESRSGMLWIGTVAGLNRFDRTAGTFTHFRHDPQNERSLGQDKVAVICKDRFGVLWMGPGVFGSGGLTRLDPTTETTLALIVPTGQSRMVPISSYFKS